MLHNRSKKKVLADFRSSCRHRLLLSAISAQKGIVVILIAFPLCQIMECVIYDVNDCLIRERCLLELFEQKQIRKNGEQ